MIPLRLAAAPLALCLAVMAPSASAGTPCHATDLMPSYAAFMAATEGLPPPARADRFVREFVPRFSGFYLVGGITDPAALRQPAIDYFSGGPNFPGMAPADPARLAQVARIVADGFPAWQRQFLAAFPDFECRTDVVFGVSLGRFDGTAVQGARRTYLLFGLDTIARIWPTALLPALTQHELFHLYHRQVQPAGAALDPTPVWWGLWSEGLAVNASAQLHPEVPADALFGYPADLTAAIAPKRRAIAALLLARMDATGDGYAPFFTANQNPPGLPPRAGYWFGADLVRRLAADHPLAELARLDPAAVRALVLDYLRREAAGTP